MIFAFPMTWPQNYDPFQNPVLSMLVALLPITVLIGLLLTNRVKAYLSAIIALGSALGVAILAFRMPVEKAITAGFFGAIYGLLPIGWIVLNVIFLFGIFLDAGVIQSLQSTLITVTTDRRLQLLMVAFCFGSILEGAAGFGTPVAITAAILIGFNFTPLQASTLSLLANTAPVAFGGLGTPIIALQGVTGLDLMDLSGTVGLLLAPFGVLVPSWMVCVYVGWKKMKEIFPVLLIAGISFSITQYAVSRFHGPWLVGIVAGLVSLVCTLFFIRRLNHANPNNRSNQNTGIPRIKSFQKKVLLPWLILVGFVVLWGVPQMKSLLDRMTIEISIPFLDQMVLRMPPIAISPRAESAVFRFTSLSATGTAIFLSAWVNGWILGYAHRDILRFFQKALYNVRFSLFTISAMMALGFVTRYCGMDASIGLVFSRAGMFYPFFGTLLGWLGVALTGSDTSSNVLFGSLQRITAEQLGFDPVIMASANSAGGVMGKMIDAQSIVVAGTATRWHGHEDQILRGVMLHSIVLAVLVGVVTSVVMFSVK